MHHLSINADTSNVSIHVFIEDTRLSDGSGLTGLKHSTSGLEVYYMRSGQHQTVCQMLSSSAADTSDFGPTKINLVDACAGSWKEGGFMEIDASKMPGLYELQLPNACLSSGSHTCNVMLRGASNMAVTNVIIDLTSNLGKISGRVVSVVSSTQLETDLSGESDDQYNGRLLTFVSGDLVGLSTLVIDYTASSNYITHAAINGTPVAGDTFIIE